MKILIASTYKKGTLMLGRHCQRAFTKLGHDAKIFDIDQKGLVDRILLRPVEKLTQKEIRAGFLEPFKSSNLINKKLIIAVEEFRPDILFVIKGVDFTGDTIRKMGDKYNIVTARWWLDDPDDFERSVKTASAYNYVFTMHRDSVEKYRAIGVDNVSYLPFACDSDFYSPLNLTEAEKEKYSADISFVGRWLPVREELILKLTGYHIKIWGPGWAKRLKGDKRFKKIIQGDGVYGRQVVKVFNASRINLNIHSWFGLNYTAVNMRMFDIPGSGGFLLTDYLDEATEFLEARKEASYYHNADEMKEKIDYYLNNEDERLTIADGGREKILKEHTYEERMKELLNALGAEE